MKATEIRQGNIVKRQYYNPNPGNTTYQYEPCFVKSIGIAKAHVTESLNLKHNKLIKIDYNSILPILLTEEWIIKFKGITKHNDYYSFSWGGKNGSNIGTLIIFVHPGYNKIAIELGKGLSHICEYVHKFQNIVFEITEKELELKEIC